MKWLFKKNFSWFDVVAVSFITALAAVEEPWLFVGAVVALTTLASVYVERKLVL